MPNTKARAGTALGHMIWREFAKDRSQEVLEWIDRAMTIYKKIKEEQEKSKQAIAEKEAKAQSARIKKHFENWEKFKKEYTAVANDAKKFEPPVKAAAPSAKPALPKDLSKINKSWFDKTLKDMMADINTAKAAHKSFDAYKPPDFSVGAISKMYLDVIKKHDGATEPKPKVTKALKAAEGKNPTQKALEAAKKNIQEHTAELKKSKDPKAKTVIKKFHAMEGDIDEKLGS